MSYIYRSIYNNIYSVRDGPQSVATCMSSGYLIMMYMTGTVYDFPLYGGIVEQLCVTNLSSYIAPVCMFTCTNLKIFRELYPKTPCWKGQSIHTVPPHGLSVAHEGRGFQPAKLSKDHSTIPQPPIPWIEYYGKRA
jgi:hypothetical protein